MAYISIADRINTAGGVLRDALEGFEPTMAYGDLPELIERAAMYGDPEHLAGQRVAELRAIARELGIAGRSSMRSGAGRSPSASSVLHPSASRFSPQALSIS